MRPVELSSFGARLRALRRARGLSQIELARAIGRHQSVIGPYERDEYTPARPVLERLAAVLDTNPEYLLFGRSPHRSRLPVGGRVGPAGVVRDDPAEAPTFLELREERLMLLEVGDDSMSPVYPVGALVVVDTAERSPARLAYGREALVELTDGRRLLRRLFPAATAGQYDLAAYNAPCLRGVTLHAAHPAVGCLRRDAFAS